MLTAVSITPSLGVLSALVLSLASSSRTGTGVDVAI